MLRDPKEAHWMQLTTELPYKHGLYFSLRACLVFHGSLRTYAPHNIVANWKSDISCCQLHSVFEELWPQTEVKSCYLMDHIIAKLTLISLKFSQKNVNKICSADYKNLQVNNLLVLAGFQSQCGSEPCLQVWKWSLGEAKHLHISKH